MNRIEKNLGCLNADEFEGCESKFIEVLGTGSNVRLDEALGRLEVVKYRDADLESIQEDERK